MENIEKMSRVQKLTFSAMVMALYIVILYFTQSFSFGAYQIRIATSLYALSYLFPFLVLHPLVSLILYRICCSEASASWICWGGCIVGIVAASLYCPDPEKEVEPYLYCGADRSGAGVGGSDISVLFSGNSVSADGDEPVYRTDRSGHCGRGSL